MPRGGSVSGCMSSVVFRQRHSPSLCSLLMAPVLTFLLNLLCRLPCKLRGFVSRCFNFKSWTLFLAFLGRRLGLWRPWKSGKNKFRRSEQEKAGHSFPGTGGFGGGEVRVDVSRDPAIVACSSIPASARHPSSSQADLSVLRLSAATPPPPGPASLTANPQHEHPQAYPLSVLGVGLHANRSWSSLSAHSRASASDRLSIIQSRSYESLQSLGQKKQGPKAAHRQFGCGPSTDNLSSHSHTSTNLISGHGHDLTRSSVNVIVKIQNPSNESLPHNQSTGSPAPQEEPYSIGSSTLYSSPSSKPSNLREQSPEPTLTTSLVPDFELPEGRFLQMITSEQVPRYTKNVTV